MFRPKKLDLAALLNEAQYEAAVTTEGPLLVLAGAGSGKTRVLVHRIAHIVGSGLAYPSEILAVTFTNKAAGEMKDRLERLIGEDLKRSWIGTFHSMCGRILRMEGHRLGFTSSFTIYDTDDAKRTVRRVMEDLKMDTKKASGLSVNGVLHEIDQAKNKGLSPKDLQKIDVPFFQPAAVAARKVYPRYQEALRRNNAMDFGDLLLLAVELLKHHPEVLHRFQDKFRYVMVDEFQDTNSIQYDLLKLLVAPHENLAVVGDDDQSIYRWRGAEVRNILDFQKTFPGAKTVKLEKNYRSSANILAAANAVIQKNENRHKKTLYTDAPEGLPIGVAMLNHGDEEAWLVSETIAHRVRAGEPAESFAILYRQNAQSRPFEQALRRARVPYTLIGATSFFERKEVKDLLAYLRLVANPNSQEDFERIINVPGRSIGDKTVERLRELADQAGIAGTRVLDLEDDKLSAIGIKGKTLEKIRELGRLFRELEKLAATESATEVAQEIVSRTKYLAYLEKEDPVKAEDRIQNVEELVNSIAEHESLYSEATDPETGDPLTLAGAKTPLQAFLDEAALISTGDQRSKEGAVSLLTLHAAKGLEFPVVFLVGMEENTFPTRRAVEGDSGDMEEERRLCYVGFTRPMRELNLSCVRFRRVYGTDEVRRPSRFLGDLPEAIVTNFGQPGAEAPRSSSAFRPRGGPMQVRGGDFIELDDPTPFLDPFMDGGEQTFEEPSPPADGDTLRRGARVSHNTFGLGVVEQVEGIGPRAHLTIRFPTVGTKRVVARFVQPADEP